MTLEQLIAQQRSAIAALLADNYEGRDRITAFAAVGAVSGAAVAAGPLIGGFVTTYFSWRYVFVAEVVIMFFVVLFALSVWRGLGYYGRDPTDPDEGPSSGLTVHTDAATGCEYLSVGGSALVPRYATDGGQMGCR